MAFNLNLDRCLCSNSSHCSDCRLWLLVGSDRPTDRPIMSLIELSWTAKKHLEETHKTWIIAIAHCALSKRIFNTVCSSSFTPSTTLVTIVAPLLLLLLLVRHMSDICFQKEEILDICSFMTLTFILLRLRFCELWLWPRRNIRVWVAHGWPES